MKKKLQQTMQKYRDYCEQLYANNVDNLEKMDKFLERYNVPKLKQEKIEKPNRPSTSMEIKNVIKKSFSKQKPRTRYLNR